MQSPAAWNAGYLERMRAGDERQRAAAAAVDGLGVLETLDDLDPRLCGTLPIGVHRPLSDVDVALYAPEIGVVHDRLAGLYSERARFSIFSPGLADRPYLVCSFLFSGVPFELYAAPVPTARQAAVLHLQVEDRLLSLLGDPLRRAVVALRAAGEKTEPAFARALGLVGDPYFALLALADESDEKLAALSIARFGTG